MDEAQTLEFIRLQSWEKPSHLTLTALPKEILSLIFDLVSNAKQKCINSQSVSWTYVELEASEIFRTR